MQTVIIITGLGDHSVATYWATKHWRSRGLAPVIFPMMWNDGEAFKIKLGRLLGKIDKCSASGDEVSLIGCSAGASAALNAFFERRDKISKAISVCGRLRVGDQKGFRSLKTRAKSSAAFKQSVELFESRCEILTDSDKKRIMTVSARFGDELVPANTSMLDGAYNIFIPTIEHTFSIYVLLALFSSRLIAFMNN